MRFDPDEQAAIVLDAITTCLGASGVANMPDVVRMCEVNGLERTLAYKVIDRWNNMCWRRIGSSIGFIR